MRVKRARQRGLRAFGEALRQRVFQNLPPEAWKRRGVANGATISVRGQAYVIVGHERHHLQVLRERYGM